MMRKVLPPRFISFTPTIESCAGIPVRMGSSGGSTLGPPPLFFFLLDRRAMFVALTYPAYGLNIILVIG